MTLILRSAILNDIGLVRTNNEDSALAGERLVAVADGMGGLPAGEVASEIVIRILDELTPPTDPEAAAEALRAVVSTANQRIHAAITVDPAREGMGTTLTAALLAGDTLVLAQVGDSRCYLLRDTKLTQLTRDDTFVQMLVDEGVISADEAHSHPRRAVVTRALQGEPVTPAYTTLVPQAGDRWLLCSDGLSNVVRQDSLAETLLGLPDPDQCARRLVDLALRAGGPDNITVVIADVLDVT